MNDNEIRLTKEDIEKIVDEPVGNLEEEMKKVKKPGSVLNKLLNFYEETILKKNVVKK